MVALPTLAACGSSPATQPAKPAVVEKPATAEPPKGVDPDVAATVDEVLATSQHSALKWPRIPDVVAVRQPLYANEPDRLFWFDRTAPVASLKPTIAALSTAAEAGLDPSDYDVGWLEQQASLIGAGAAGADLALLDLGVSTAD